MSQSTAQNQLARALDRDAIEADLRHNVRAETHSANDLAKIRRQQNEQRKQFAQWRHLIQSDDFAAFLREDELRLHVAYQPAPQADVDEFAAIGAMLQSQGAVETALGENGLRPEHLRLNDNQNALKAIAALRKNQSAKPDLEIDFVTVAAQMRRRGTCQKNTVAHLRFCIESCPSTVNVAYYIEAVKEAARLRYLFRLGQHLADCANASNANGTPAPYSNPAQLVNAARIALDAIEQRGLANIKEIWENTK